MELTELFGVILTFIAVYYIAIPKRIGYHFATASQICWILFSISNSKYGLLFQAVGLIIVNCFALYNWTKKGIG